MDKHNREVLARLNLHDPLQLVAVGFGAGLCPRAPGTMGSLLALPFCMGLVYCPAWVFFAVIVLTFVLGVWASEHTEKVMGMHDNSSIVIDEVVGMFLSVAFYPPVWWLTGLAFVLFRLFDILKPFPISYLDRKVQGGLGIMLDDVAAGLAACLSAQIIFLACL